MNKRNRSIDIAKGLATIFVVLGHSCQLVGEGTETLHTIIQTFQMPLFMFLSGFCAFYSFPIKDRTNYFKKKVFGLYLPYCSWSILLLLVSNIRSGESISLIAIVDRLVNSGFWFLRILFYIFILVILADYLCELINEKICWHRGIVILLVWVSVFAIACVANNLPGCYNLYKHFLFFQLGMFIHFIEFKKNNNRRIDHIIFLLNAFIYILSAFCITNVNYPLVLKLADISAAVSGTLGIYYLCKIFSMRDKGNTYIEKLGSNSLGIYAFHWNIMFALRLGDFTNVLSFLKNDILVAILMAVIWIIISLFAVTIIYKFKWSRNFLLGKM